ncbi:YiiX/YebB-like N1pC/P60 family cysteine hydrolase [Aridibaculum aurantiacum]|uniref:YiiX/YebB-like N1pC/P60 family cysteine hydrolase n=1 Tax=Aridibaculum aurantiacum TaxID=2810307 RepID=UPI001A9607D8|nr:YiiX/YebB-like N1pC/P60 family cysteine hydrolase [Aridibaculum aurantiacum]
MKITAIVAAVWMIGFTACQSASTTQPALEQSAEQRVQQNIQQLKAAAQPGDLLVRLNDDLISDRVRYINEKDHSYSHTGIVVTKENKIYVAHIAPEQKGADTIQYIPIDSFINAAKHIKCALYRYNLSAAEKAALATTIDKYKNADVRFDAVYDITDDDKMYCSEMISKALETATGKRLQFRQANIPKQMQKMVVHFFAKVNATDKQIAERKIMTIDNLYLHPDCNLVMEFPLKYFPDQVH